jgi:hypothetical protein
MIGLIVKEKKKKINKIKIAPTKLVHDGFFYY